MNLGLFALRGQGQSTAPVTHRQPLCPRELLWALLRRNFTLCSPHQRCGQSVSRFNLWGAPDLGYWVRCTYSKIDMFQGDVVMIDGCQAIVAFFAKSSALATTVVRGVVEVGSWGVD